VPAEIETTRPEDGQPPAEPDIVPPPLMEDEPEEEIPPVGYAGILRRTPSPDSVRREIEPDYNEHGFTKFEDLVPGPTVLVPVEKEASLIDVLPRMLPGFADIAAAASDRPFSIMPETMPPPPLRPILPPELQGEPERPGLISRLLGRRE
jgi:hypothetical protein